VKSVSTDAVKPQGATAPPQPPEAPPTETASNANLLKGAQATVPAGSFDTRWSAMR